MICYMAQRKADGFLDYRYISPVPVDAVGSRWDGWTLVPVEVRPTQDGGEMIKAEIIQEIYKMTCTSPTHTPARRHLRDMLDYFEDIDEKNFGEHQPELLRLAAQIVRVLETERSKDEAGK